MALILFVNTWAGETFPIELDICATVGDLKMAVEEIEGTPAGHMRLVHLGEPLGSNDTPLADTGISSQATVQMEAGSDDAVVEIFVKPQPRAATHPPSCLCDILNRSCGKFRRVQPDPASRTIDLFVRVDDDAADQVCTDMAMHLRRSDYKCALGSKCWFYRWLKKSPDQRRETPFIRRNVQKGRMMPGGLSIADCWEFSFGRKYTLRQDMLLAEWAVGGGGPKSACDPRHWIRGGGAYPLVECSHNCLETASLLKAKSRHKLEL